MGVAENRGPRPQTPYSSCLLPPGPLERGLARASGTGLILTLPPGHMSRLSGSAILGEVRLWESWLLWVEGRVDASLNSLAM